MSVNAGRLGSRGWGTQVYRTASDGIWYCTSSGWLERQV